MCYEWTCCSLSCIVTSKIPNALTNVNHLYSVTDCFDWVLLRHFFLLLNGYFAQKYIYKIYQYLLTLMSFQTCMIFLISKSTTEFHCTKKCSLDILPLLLNSISGKSNVQYMSTIKGDRIVLFEWTILYSKCSDTQPARVKCIAIS